MNQFKQLIIQFIILSLSFKNYGKCTSKSSAETLRAWYKTLRKFY